MRKDSAPSLGGNDASVVSRLCDNMTSIILSIEDRVRPIQWQPIVLIFRQMP
jgi:hypothetical protein